MISGHSIRQFRGSVGLTQVEFAGLLGVERAHLSRIESGGRVLTDRVLTRFVELRAAARLAVLGA